MRVLLRGRAFPLVALGVALAIIGLVVLDGTAAGVALAAATISLFVAVLRVLARSDLSGVTHGGEGGG